MRNLAYIAVINDLNTIIDADKIECATILGWQVVVQKNQFSVGDKIVFCEIDSILPEHPSFEFLRSKNFRIRTIKLKKTLSQGIAFPLSILTDINPSFNIDNLKVGQDVTELLKITKYDPEALLDVESNQVKKSWLSNKFSYYKWKLLGIKPVKKGSFPSDVPKTNEERVQKMGTALAEREGSSVYITEKCEGTSSTFIYRRSGNWLAKLFKTDGIFQVCSRNRIVYNSQTGRQAPHFLFDVALKYDLMHQLRELNRNIAIQGEVIGPKIQGNIYKLSELELRVFSIYDLDKQEYLNCNEMLSLSERLRLTTVPLVLVNTKLINDIKYYVEYSKGKSQINNNVLREGIVVRSMNDNFSFKSISPEYLLRQE